MFEKDLISVDVFAGAGGASVGLRQAGFYHELCVEWDEDAANTLVAAGFPGVCGDVRDLSLYEGVDRIDLLWASPPCQAFSTAGDRKGALDDRNGWPWTLDIIDHFKERGIGPGYVICENVPGLTYHSGDCTGDANKCPGCYWESWIIPEFEKRFEWVGHMMLDAADFGVPQHRRRVFLVAGDKPIRWPEATHGPPNTALQGTMFGSPVKPWVTIRDALGIDKWATETNTSSGMARVPRDADVPSCSPVASGNALGGLLEVRVIGGGRNPTPRENDKRTYRDITDEPSTTVAAVTIGNAGPFVVTEESEEEQKPDWFHRISPIDEPTRTIGTMGNASIAKPGSEPWRLDKPSPAVTARDQKGARHQKFDPSRSPMTAADATWRAAGIRRLTWRECAKLQSFPDDHPFQGKTKKSLYRQVGNAVCPPISEVLGKAVIDAMR